MSFRSRSGLAATTVVLVAACGALWGLRPGPAGRTEVLPMDGLTASGTGLRVERVGGGARLVSFGSDGGLLGIPLGRELEGRRLRLGLSDVQGLAWVGVSLWREGAPRSEPVSMGRAIAFETSSLDLDFSLPDGAYRAAHVELRPVGSSGSFTLQSIELRPQPVSPPPLTILLSAALLAGGAASFLWLTVSAFRRLPPRGRRRLAVAVLVVGLGAPLLLLGALTVEEAAEGVPAATSASPLARTIGLPARLLGDLRSDLHHVALQSGAGARGGLRRIDIHLSPLALATLDAKRREALRSGVLIAEEGDEVAGYLSLDGGDPVRIRTRLKGDWVDHLEDHAFSLRVRIRGPRAVLGMRRFSIQRPQTRVGHYEAIVLDQMRAEGIVAPRYEFVRFFLNGEEVGVMAVEEFMSGELLEANRRREGVILALDEDDLWRQRRLDGVGPDGAPGPRRVLVFEAAHRAPVRTFQESRVLSDPTLRLQYAEAMGLLRGYLEGSLALEDVFDVTLLGRFFAIVNLWNADHPTWWHNVRLYFNPVTRLLEPIAFDINVRMSPPAPGVPPEWLGSDVYHLRGSEIFLRSYHEAMDRLREQVRSGELESHIRRWEAAHYARLAPGDLQDPPYPVSLMRARLAALDRVAIDRKESFRHEAGPPAPIPEHATLAEFVHVFWVRDGGGSYLEFQNVTERPVTIERVEYRHRRLDAAVSLGLGRLRVPGGDRPGERLRVPVPHDPFDLDGRVFVVATLDERNAHREVEARRYLPAAHSAAFRPEDPGSFLERFPFVERKERYRIPSGTWDVDSDMLVPADTGLVVEAGATLRFAPGTRLVLRTPLTIPGEADRPVRLEAQAGAWAGLVVLQAQGRSSLRHVDVSGIEPPARDRWALTGAVTFYESDVTMEEVRIHGTRTEDALNIVRSDFVLGELEIREVPSDALDVDFGEGTIARSRFLEMGGDAVDVSGTRITVEGTSVAHAGDKAFSVGEASTFAGRDLEAAHVGTGIVSKDGSSAILADSHMEDVTHAAFMAYEKKTEFGPARLVVERTSLQRVGQTAAPVGLSTVEIDGWRVPRVELDVGRLYRTGYMAR